MAEGLDNAARLFQVEINPQAKPRDENTGRFTPAAKPEPLFEERRLEGDPLTGDTRDGGDDARLAAHERRVADGWAEEGDEAPVQSGRAAAEQADRRNRQSVSSAEAGEGARHAAADQGHQGAEAEPGRVDEAEPEQRDQDAQGPDEGAKADAEEQGPKYEVTVDGETKEVSLTEALQGYVRAETFQHRMNQLGEARQTIEVEAHRTMQARDQVIERLQQLDEEIGSLVPMIDWDAEYRANPTAAYEKQKNFNTVVGRRQALQQERANLIQQQAQQHAENVARYAREGYEQFKRYTRISDQATLNNELMAMRRVGQEIYGFNEQELSEVYDPRMLAVLHDASKYRRALANQPRPVSPDKGRTLAPGSARPTGSAVRKSIDDALRKQAVSGSIDDTATVMERLLR